MHLSSVILRKLMQAEQQQQQQDNDEYETRIVLEGTAPVSDEPESTTTTSNSYESTLATTTLSNFEKGKEHLHNMENMINDVSKKMKSTSLHMFIYCF